MNSWDKDYYAKPANDRPYGSPAPELHPSPVWDGWVGMRLLISPREKLDMFLEVLILETTDDGQFVKLGSFFDGKTFWDRTQDYHLVKYIVQAVLGDKNENYLELNDGTNNGQPDKNNFRA
jgi:hypothetical protein